MQIVIKECMKAMGGNLPRKGISLWGKKSHKSGLYARVRMSVMIRYSLLSLPTVVCRTTHCIFLALTFSAKIKAFYGELVLDYR